ncbi:MAG: hypothetical protein WBA17_00845 [Saprospiraceae bacterium]
MRITALLIFFTSTLTAQTLTNHGLSQRWEGDGTIECKYAISITVDRIARPHYINGDHVGEYVQYSGTCRYDNSSQNISLVGSRVQLFSQDGQYGDSLLLYEMDEQFNKVAVFDGSLTRNGYIGFRQMIGSPDRKEFALTFTMERFTELEVSTPWGKRLLPTGHHNQYNQNHYKLIRTAEQGGKMYVLVQFDLTVCGAVKSRGQGCGGHYQYLRLYTLTPAGVTYQEVLLNGRDAQSNSRKLVTAQIKKEGYTGIITGYRATSEVRVEFSVNFDRLQDGIRETKLK